MCFLELQAVLRTRVGGQSRCPLFGTQSRAFGAPSAWWPVAHRTANALDGYRQTWAYLAAHEDALRRALVFDSSIEEKATQLLRCEDAPPAAYLQRGTSL